VIASRWEEMYGEAGCWIEGPARVDKWVLDSPCPAVSGEKLEAEFS